MLGRAGARACRRRARQLEIRPVSDVRNDIVSLEGHMHKAGKLAVIMTWARRYEKPFTITIAKAQLPYERHQIRISLERLCGKGYLRRKRMPMQRRCGRAGSAIMPMWVYFPTKMLMDEPL
jgi:hypothetical protein